MLLFINTIGVGDSQGKGKAPLQARHAKKNGVSRTTVGRNAHLKNSRGAVRNHKIEDHDT